MKRLCRFGYAGPFAAAGACSWSKANDAFRFRPPTVGQSASPCRDRDAWMDEWIGVSRRCAIAAPTFPNPRHRPWIANSAFREIRRRSPPGDRRHAKWLLIRERTETGLKAALGRQWSGERPPPSRSKIRQPRTPRCAIRLFVATVAVIGTGRCPQPRPGVAITCGGIDRRPSVPPRSKSTPRNPKSFPVAPILPDNGGRQGRWPARGCPAARIDRPPTEAPALGAAYCGAPPGRCWTVSRSRSTT